MSPLEISILLHYHTSKTDYRGGDFDAPAVREAINNFIGNGVLVERVVGAIGDGTYEMTERGIVWVKHICSIPLPEQRWEMPKVS
jgi:hypothetical protein